MAELKKGDMTLIEVLAIVNCKASPPPHFDSDGFVSMSELRTAALKVIDAVALGVFDRYKYGRCHWCEGSGHQTNPEARMDFHYVPCHHCEGQGIKEPRHSVS